MAKKLRKAREKLNARRNAHAQTVASRNINPAGFRQPGSMKRKRG